MNAVLLLGLLALAGPTSAKIEIIKEYRWVYASKENVSSIADLVSGGKDSNGDSLYVCRCVNCEGGNMIPGKIDISGKTAWSRKCIVAYNYVEYDHTKHFQVLTNPNGYSLIWVPETGGKIPEGAIPSGRVDDRWNYDNYYIGRGRYQGSLQIGKVHPKHRVLYFGWNGVEKSLKDYEVLVVEKVTPERRPKPRINPQPWYDWISDDGKYCLSLQCEN